MLKIFDDARDKNVANYVVFGKDADSKIYVDAEFETQATQAEIEDAFKKGRLAVAVSDGNEDYNYLVPIALEANKVITATLVSTTLTATAWEAEATPAG